jgi:hypothetical protein
MSYTSSKYPHSRFSLGLQCGLYGINRCEYDPEPRSSEGNEYGFDQSRQILHEWIGIEQSENASISSGVPKPRYGPLNEGC